jgi:hypothetical protein
VTLNLDPHQMKQAESQKAAADGAVTARLPETYQWLLVPEQRSPQATVEWQSARLSGQDALAVRASKKLRGDEHLVAGFAPSRLRMELDRVPLWRGDHVAIMPKHRSDGERKSVPCGGVKAASRASGSAKALALTRLKDTDIVMPSRAKPRLTPNTVVAQHHDLRLKRGS